MESNINVFTLFAHGAKYINLKSPTEIDNIDISDTNYFFLSIVQSGSTLDLATGYMFQLALQNGDFANKFIEPLEPIKNKKITNDIPICSTNSLANDIIVYGLHMMFLKEIKPDETPIIKTPYYVLYCFLKEKTPNTIDEIKLNLALPISTLSNTIQRLLATKMEIKMEIKMEKFGLDYNVMKEKAQSGLKNTKIINYYLSDSFFSNIECKLYWKFVPNRELQFTEKKRFVKLGVVNIKTPDFQRPDNVTKAEYMMRNKIDYFTNGYSDINGYLSCKNEKTKLAQLAELDRLDRLTRLGEMVQPTKPAKIKLSKAEQIIEANKKKQWEKQTQLIQQTSKLNIYDDEMLCKQTKVFLSNLMDNEIEFIGNNATRYQMLNEIIDELKTSPKINNLPTAKNLFILISCEGLYDVENRDTEITDKKTINLYRLKSAENREEQIEKFRKKYLIYKTKYLKLKAQLKN